MPPKKGSKKKEPAEEKKDPADEFVTEEMLEMQTSLRFMKAELTKEKKLLNDFQLQKEKLEKFWTMEKKKRDDFKMVFRNKLRQKQDLEEKHEFELKVYKQKVKHLLHEQQAHMTDVRTDGEKALKLLEDDQRDNQHEFKSNLRSFKMMQKEMELGHHDLIKSIKTNQEIAIMTLRQDMERKAGDLKRNYEKKMKKVRESCDEKRRNETTALEGRKTKHIHTLMSMHKSEFDKIKVYYREITNSNLDLIKTLKEEVGDMKKKEQGVQKELAEISRLNKKLSKPLQKNKKLVEELKTKLSIYERDQVRLAETKESLLSYEEKNKNLEWEEEIFLQKHSRLKDETGQLTDKLQATIYKVQQKTGFKNLLLEKKLEAMSQDLEKTESALAEVLASTNLRPEIIGDIKHNLEDVLMAKNKQVQKLEDSLADLKQAYANTINVYEEKLAEHSIPREQLGFTPVRRF